MKKLPGFALTALLVLGGAASAQQAAPGQVYLAATPPVSDVATETPAIRMLELSTSPQSLSNGYGHWQDLTLRGAYGMPGHVLQGELAVMRRFGEKGSFAGISDTMTFNDDWFASLAIGAGDGAFYLPRFRADAMLYRKWLDQRRLVTSVGLGYYDAPDGHTDRSLSLGAAYYFDEPWVVEGGVRLNSSSPGSVRTSQRFVAVTWGRDKQDRVTARHTWGGEGYLATGPTTQLVNFDSHETSIAWRHWVTPRSGFLLGANRYSNPLYRRSGLTVGVFHDF